MKFKSSVFYIETIQTEQRCTEGRATQLQTLEGASNQPCLRKQAHKQTETLSFEQMSVVSAASRGELVWPAVCAG